MDPVGCARDGDIGCAATSADFFEVAAALACLSAENARLLLVRRACLDGHVARRWIGGWR